MFWNFTFPGCENIRKCLENALFNLLNIFEHTVLHFFNQFWLSNQGHRFSLKAERNNVSKRQQQTFLLQSCVKVCIYCQLSSSNDLAKNRMILKKNYSRSLKQIIIYC